MDATSRLTWLHIHATSSRWQILACSWAKGLDQGPLLSPRVNTCLFSPSNESLVDISGSVFMYLAAEVQQEDWLQSRLLCLFPLRPLWRDDVSVRTDSGTERPISHSSGLISFYWQGSRSLQWWVSGPPEGFSEGKPRPVCSDIKASLRSKARLLDVHTLLAPLLAFLLIQVHHLFSYFLWEHQETTQSEMICWKNITKSIFTFEASIRSLFLVWY